MDTISKISELKSFSENYRKENPGKKIGLVPTMGYLHEGHLSLIREIKKTADIVIVSIFVNPLQFNNPEDLNRYPHDLDHDIVLLEGAGADILFSPSRLEVFPQGNPDIFIDYPDITNKLCGKYRPGHFSGVMTIVHNLFQWARPHLAAFGRKDYQQLLLIKKMNEDLHMGVQIIEGDTIRQEDGLAMSSRNARLSDREKMEALKIPEALFAVKDLFLNHLKQGRIEITPLKNILVQKLEGLKVEYASIYDPLSLEDAGENFSPPFLAAVAAYVGDIRLIDNILLREE